MNIADFIDSMISIVIGVVIYTQGLKQKQRPHAKKMKIAGIVVIVIGVILFFERLFR